jgi:hypothetical protein
MAAVCWAAGKPSGGVYITMTRRDGPAAGSTIGAGAGAGAGAAVTGSTTVVFDVQAVARPVAAASTTMMNDFIARSS